MEGFLKQAIKECSEKIVKDMKVWIEEAINEKGADKMDNEIRQAIGTMVEKMGMTEKEAFWCIVAGFENGEK